MFWVQRKVNLCTIPVKGEYFHSNSKEGYLEKQAAQLILQLENHRNEESEMMLKMLSNPANTITSAKLQLVQFEK